MTDDRTKWPDVRLDDLAQDMKRLETLPHEVGLVKQSVENLAQEFVNFRTDAEQQRREARDDIRALRTALLGFALTIATTSIGAILAVVTGLIG